MSRATDGARTNESGRNRTPGPRTEPVDGSAAGPRLSKDAGARPGVPARPRPDTRYLRIGRAVALPVRPSAVLAGLVVLLLLVAAAAATLSMGRLGIAVPDLPGAILHGTGVKERFVLERLRGPRLTVAAGTGAALGLSGALFQTVTRNPLGSPDVIGLAAGAGAGAAAVALLVPGGAVPVAAGALAGAVLSMVLVYVSTGSGFRHPGRLIVAGIGVNAMATACTQYVVYAVERDKASSLAAYVNGSVAARSWSDAATVWIALAVLSPALLLLAPRLTMAETGEEFAAGVGARPRTTRVWAVLLSIVLSAVAVSVAGPVAFISLTAPQIARRLTRGTGPRLVLSALVGSLLLVVADLAAQQLPLPVALPVGVYTLAVGGLYLGWLLVREWRKGSL